MGLDNGIEVKRTPTSEVIAELEQFKQNWDKNNTLPYEFAYFRKCWNVRGAIIDSIEGGFNDNGETKLTKDDVRRIIVALKAFNADNWESGLGSIWSWEEQEPHIQRYIGNLELLVELMEHNDLDVVFYDSY